MRIQKLPKVELHCHLDGSMSIETLYKFYCQKNQIDNLDYHKFTKLVQVDHNCTSLSEYLKAFHLPLQYLDQEDKFFISTYELLKEVAKENVRYIEIRFAPQLSESDQLSCEKIIEAVIKALEKGKKDFDVDANLILCGLRQFDVNKNLITVELAKKYLHKGVCAIDLAGDESKYPNHLFQEVFQKAKQYQIPITIHSGECGSVKNIELAVAYGANRIGHGIAMAKNQVVQELVKQNQIGVELCPSSNLQTKAVASWEEYPFREFYENGILVSINTDNRTVTNTTITKELELLIQHCNLTTKEMAILMKQAIKCSFANQKIKDKMKKEILAWEKEFV